MSERSFSNGNGPGGCSNLNGSGTGGTHGTAVIPIGPAFQGWPWPGGHWWHW